MVRLESAVEETAEALGCWLLGDDIDASAPAGSLATAAALALIGAGAGAAAATGMIPGTIWLAIAVPTAVTNGLGTGGVR